MVWKRWNWAASINYDFAFLIGNNFQPLSKIFVTKPTNKNDWMMTIKHIWWMIFSRFNKNINSRLARGHWSKYPRNNLIPSHSYKHWICGLVSSFLSIFIKSRDDGCFPPVYKFFMFIITTNWINSFRDIWDWIRLPEQLLKVAELAKDSRNHIQF